MMLSVTAILIASLLAGSGTFAYFSDTEKSIGNKFTTGTLDAKIRDGGYDYRDDIGAVWVLSDLKPGDGTGSRSFSFKNYGLIEIDHMEITCDYSVIESVEEPDTDPKTNEHPDEMAAEFTIKSLGVHEDTGLTTDLLPVLDDWNHNGRKDLEDLKHAGIDDVTTVPNANQGSFTTVDMVLEFDSGAGSDFQGDTFGLTIIFTFNQHSSQ